MARTARLAVEIDATGARRGASEASRELARLKGEAGGVAQEFDALKAAMAGIAGALSVQQIVQYADSFTRLRNNLKQAGLDGIALKSVQDKLFASAQTYGVELEGLSGLFGSVTRASAELGATQGQVLTLTEAVAASLSISGTSAEEAGGSLLQLSQALRGGTIQAEEFNSLIDGLPVLLQAAASGSDRFDGSVAKLIRAVKDGKVTSDEFFRAILGGADALKQQAASSALTTGQAFTQLGNSLTVYIGELDQAVGATAGFARAVKTLADNIGTVAPIVALIGGSLLVRFTIGLVAATAAKVRAAAAAANLARINATLAASYGAAGAAAAGSSTVISASALALARVGVAARLAGAGLLALVGGPIGAGLLALGAATYYLYSVSRQAVQPSKAFADGLLQQEKNAGAASKAADQLATATGKARAQAVAHAQALIVETRRQLAAAQATLIHAQAKAALARGEAKAVPKIAPNPFGAFSSPIIAAQRLFDPRLRKAEQTAADEKAAEATYLGFLKDITTIQNAITGFKVPTFDVGDKPKKSLRDAAGEADRLAEFGQDAARQIADLRRQFDGTPADIAQAQAATADLDKLLADLEKRKPPGFAQMVADIREVGGLIEGSLSKPFEEMLRTQERQIAVQRLLGEGREFEADQLKLQFQLMEALGVEEESQLAVALAKRGVRADDYRQLFQNLGVMQQLTAEEEKRARVREERLRVVQDLRTNIEDTLSELPDGVGKAIGNFFGNLRRSFNDYFARSITENLFGDVFRELDAEISGKNAVIAADKAVADANVLLARSVNATAAKLEQLGNAAAGAANGIAGSPVANDNDSAIADAAQEIVVTGSRIGKEFDVFARSFQKLFERFLGSDAPLAKTLGKLIGQALEGAAIGQIAGGLLGSKGSKTGSAIGGALGKIAGDALGKAIGGALGKVVPVIGPIIGGLLGGAIGGLFKKAKTGSATITLNSGSGEFDVSTSGNSSRFREAASGSARNVISGLQSVVDRLGGALTGNPSVSIGVRDGNFRVDPTGRGNTRTRRGAIDFGDDEAAAVKFAILDAIRDGVITGLRAGTQRLLGNGNDLDAQLEKALSFENVFRDLRQRTDPVGAAIDDLNKEFERLKRTFRDAGASAEEYADLERLYQLRRVEAIEQANNQSLQAMKDYLFELRAGTSSVLSPQLRLQNARAELDRLDALRASGGNVSFDQYRTAADAFLAASRDFNGSTLRYFGDFERITTTIERWLAADTARQNTNLPSVDFAPVVSVLTNQTNVTTALLQQVNANLANLQSVFITAAARISNDNTVDQVSLNGAGIATRYYKAY